MLPDNMLIITGWRGWTSRGPMQPRHAKLESYAFRFALVHSCPVIQQRRRSVASRWRPVSHWPTGGG